jgi:hypothetical protein
MTRGIAAECHFIVAQGDAVEVRVAAAVVLVADVGKKDGTSLLRPRSLAVDVGLALDVNEAIAVGVGADVWLETSGLNSKTNV